MASTPAMFMTTVDDELAVTGGVMITASHLPFNRNGLKFFTKEGDLRKLTSPRFWALQVEVTCPSGRPEESA